MNMSKTTSDAIMAELLCIADSTWVLGHWYTICMLNGRELTDFTSMAGIAEDKLGHTRALFQFMEEYFDLPEHQLEFGRPAERLHNMELLDAPPESWADFVLTLYLADSAIWQFSNTLREGSFAPVASLVTKFGEEAYFHQLCLDGWLKALTDEERLDLRSRLSSRIASALRWFDNGGSDALVEAGIRAVPVDRGREEFVDDVCSRLAPIAGVSDAELRALFLNGDSVGWDARRRRASGSAMPPGLWEAIVPTSEEAMVARRPIAISVDDNIDLFVNAKKDETEPQFA